MRTSWVIDGRLCPSWEASNPVLAASAPREQGVAHARPGSRLPVGCSRILGLLVRAALVVALSACGGEDDVATPSSFEQCNHEPGPRGDLPGFGGVALHYTGAEHGFDQPGEFFVCLKAGWSGDVQVLPPDGVEVTPTSQPVPGSGTGVVRFQVRVESGSAGRLYASVSVGSDGATLVTEIDSNDDGWSFRELE